MVRDRYLVGLISARYLMRFRGVIVGSVLFAAAALVAPTPVTAAPPKPTTSGSWKELRLEPPAPALAGPGASQRFIISAIDDQGNSADVTAEARLSSSRPDTVAVDVASGLLVAKSTGVAPIEVEFAGLKQQFPVEVREGSSELAVSFSRDVVSILTTKGCNGSGCHGSPAGKNGFKLSLFGYDSAADHKMIVHGHDGRRVSLDDPAESLFLKKPTFAVAHGGGHLMTPESEEYETLYKWLEQGARSDDSGARLTHLELYPRQRVLVGGDASQKFVAMGRLSDGTTRDMTEQVRFMVADEAVAKVSDDATVSVAGPGLTSLMARAMGKVATSQIGVIDEPAGSDYPTVEAENFIDEIVFRKMREMNVLPAPRTTDREFVRRVYLDAAGVLPTREQRERFLGDTSPDKRARLIDEILAGEDYVRHWLVKFEDWYRNNQLHSQGRSMGVFKDWMRDWLTGEGGYDDLVRSFLTSTGDTMVVPEANFWHPSTDFMLKEFSTTKVTPSVTRLLLGVRMECAECHNHPLENFTQDDFYGFAAFFGRLRVKHGYGEYRRTWYIDDEGEVEHPVTKQPVAPKFLAGAVPEIPEGTDRRQVLADWITAADNPFFARATVNRIWNEYFQSGIVEPFDDFRSTNMPSNPELLDRLAIHFIQNGFRFRPLHRLILNSRVYQSASKRTGPTPLERTLFANYAPRRLTSEVLLDAISDVTGSPHVFVVRIGTDGPQAYPMGTRAKDIYIPDSPEYFLRAFGTPRRDIIQDRVKSPTLAQALHMMNGRTIREKVEADDNILGKRLAEGLGDSEIVAELYERAYARPPIEEERSTLTAFIASELEIGRGRRRALENVLWAVLNSKEFLLNH